MYCCERHSQVTDFLAQNVDEEDNLSSAKKVKIIIIHRYAEVDRLNSLEFGPSADYPKENLVVKCLPRNN